MMKLKHFTNKYDITGTGNLKYSDFCDAFTPKTKYIAEMLHNRQPYNIYDKTFPDQYFSPETRAQIRLCFNSIFDAAKNSEKLIEQLKNYPKVTMKDLQNCIENDSSMHVSKNEIADILNGYSRYFDQFQVFQSSPNRLEHNFA